MKKQKILALLLALILLCGIFAACDKDTASDDTAAQEVKATEEKSDKIAEIGLNEKATVEVSSDQAMIDELIASHTDADGRTFISVALEDDPGSMNPYGGGSSKPRQVVLEGIFESMFQNQGTGGEMKPIVAEGYTVSEDGYTYTVTLKDYVYDSEGNHLTASDVKFAFEIVGRDEYSWSSMPAVDAINVIDDYTLEIVYNSLNNKHINKTLTGYVFTQAAYEASPDAMITTPVGTGPYKLSNWVSGSEMVFETYDSYWETDDSKIFRNSLANVDKITYKIIKDSAQRVIAVESNSVDMCTGVAFTDLGQFEDEETYNIFSSLQDQVVTIAFNCSENSPCEELVVRQAIAYAIDSQGVLDGVDQGNGEVCYTAWASVFPDYDTKWESEDYYNYNVDKAKELLAGSNYDGSTLTIMFETNDRLASVAQVVQGYLLDVGIDLEIFPCDGALFRTYRFDNTKADLLMFTAGSSTFGGFTIMGNLNSVAADKTLIGIKEDTLAQKMDIMAENAGTGDWTYSYEAHYYVKDNCYLYSLYAPINFTVTSKVVTGFLLNQKGKDTPNCCTYIWND